MAVAQRSPQNEPEIKAHAIQRRLEAERASRFEISAVIRHPLKRDLAEQMIREELAGSRVLSADARRLFMHPSREGKLNMLAPVEARQERHGRRPKNEFRRKDGVYYWSGRVVYVTDHNSVITAILPTNAQVETLYILMPELGQGEAPERSIMRQIQRTHFAPVLRERDEPDRISGIMPVYRQRPTWFERACPEVPRWLSKEGNSWIILVLDETDRPHETAQAAYATLRNEVGDVQDVQFEDQQSAPFRLLKGKLETSRSFKLRPVLDAPGVDWNSVVEAIPNSALRWWEDLTASGRCGKLALVFSPEMARALLEIVSGGSNAAWRKTTLVPGTLIRLTSQRGKFVIGISTFIENEETTP
ncbi:MAG: hypothetical protein WC641_07390 [Patescibacteria group bacterium]